MKNLKLIVGTLATLTALAGTSLAQAQSADTPQQAQRHSMRHHHMTPNNNGCTGPVSFCNTYFGN